MEAKRKEAIEQIEKKKNKAIEDLVQQHETKYKQIKDYYAEITGINMDLINSLKIELNETRVMDQQTHKKKMRQYEKNQQVEGPLNEANNEVEQLKKIYDKHIIVK